MEHIVQFAIGIDDKAIQNRIEEYAYKDVLDKITTETMDTIFAHMNAYSRENMCKTMMEDALQSFLEERKDEIIDKAANMLATLPEGDQTPESVLFRAKDPTSPLMAGMAGEILAAGAPVVIFDASGEAPVPGAATVAVRPATGMAAVFALLPAAQTLMVAFAAERVENAGTPVRSNKITRSE